MESEAHTQHRISPLASFDTWLQCRVSKKGNSNLRVAVSWSLKGKSNSTSNNNEKKHAAAHKTQAIQWIVFDIMCFIVFHFIGFSFRFLNFLMFHSIVVLCILPTSSVWLLPVATSHPPESWCIEFYYFPHYYPWSFWRTMNRNRGFICFFICFVRFSFALLAFVARFLFWFCVFPNDIAHFIFTDTPAYVVYYTHTRKKIQGEKNQRKSLLNCVYQREGNNSPNKIILYCIKSFPIALRVCATAINFKTKKNVNNLSH